MAAKAGAGKAQDTLGTRIARLRRDKGLTQVELAERLGGFHAAPLRRRVHRFDIVKCDIKTRARRPPQTTLAFTEHGAIQAANVLNSPRAIAMGVYVVRALVQLRELLASNKDLARRLDELEARLDKKLATHDEAIAAILSAIRQLMNPPAPKRRGIGFIANIDEKP